MPIIKATETKLFIANDDKLHIYCLNRNTCEDVIIPNYDNISKTNNSNNECKTKTRKHINGIAISIDENYIAISTENKQIHIYDKKFQFIKHLTTARCASKITFTPDNDLLIADKTGDVFLCKLDQEQCESDLILGHLSMILDITTSPDGKYIITCDRDEKIRISHYPNTYNIASYCLGHKEFVIRSEICQDILISASGDGTIRLWNYKEGKQLSVINTEEFIENSHVLEEFAKEMDEEKVDITALPISDMQVLQFKNNIYVGVSVYRIDHLLIFKINPESFDNILLQRINIDKKLLQFTMCNARLYILSKNNVIVYKLDNKFVEDIRIDLDIEFLDTDHVLTQYYKRKFDNVQEYLKRKKARIDMKS